MIALGLSNLVGSFVSSLPISGSFTRSAVNNTSGVKTPLGGLFTGNIHSQFYCGDIWIFTFYVWNK